MKIAAVCHRLPSRRMENVDVLRLILDQSAPWITGPERDQLGSRVNAYFDQTGVRSRFWRDAGEKAAALGVEAGKEALEKAGTDPREVDLLLFVGVGRGWIEPAMSNLFQAELGLSNATGFDIIDACASWLRALDVADSFIETRRARNVLIVNCECNVQEHCDFVVPDIRHLDYLLPGFTIGEAVTATVVTDETPEARFRSLFRTWGEYHPLCRIPLPNQDQYRLREKGEAHDPHKFYAYGSKLVQTTMRRLVSTYRSDPYFSALRPDVGFGHSVSEAVTTEVERLVGYPAGLVYRTVQDYGNTVSASLPLGMSLAAGDGRLRRGQTVVFLVGSAGISVGMGALRY